MKDGEKSDILFEIAWRKELVERIKAPLGVLERKRDRESTASLDRLLDLEEYESVEEAHEAYGYGYITECEYERIRKRFENTEDEAFKTPAAIAYEELRKYQGRLNKEINEFKFQLLPEEEKERILAEQERLLSRKRGK